MQKQIFRLWGSRPLRYIFIGGVSYIIELAVLLSLANLLLLSSELSVAYSFWVGLIASFLLQKYFAFNNKERSKRIVGKQTLLYGLLVLFNYTFTILFISWFSSLLGLIVARTIALVLTVTWNDFSYRYIFK